MTPEQQIFDVIINIASLIFSSVVSVMFDVIFVPLLQEILNSIGFGGTP